MTPFNLKRLTCLAQYGCHSAKLGLNGILCGRCQIPLRWTGLPVELPAHTLGESYIKRWGRLVESCGVKTYG